MSKIWFVTGASRGLGLAITKTALAADEIVVGTARNPDAIRTALGESKNLCALPLDVTDAEQATAAIELMTERFGSVDVLVNNAGYGHFGPFEEASSADIENQYRVNVFGAMNVTRAVLPVMRRQNSGRIFNISSIAGLSGGAMASLYCSSKFALEGWSESLAEELEPLGIQVTAVEPGFFRTDFLDSSSVRYTEVKQPEYQPGIQAMQEWLNGKNHQQEGDPYKLAQVLVRLARSEKQPLHLLMGSDAIVRMENRIERDRRAVEEWRAVSTSTDFPQ